MSVTIARPVPVLRPAAVDLAVAVGAGGGAMVVLGGGVWAVVAGALACASGMTLGFDRSGVATGLAVAAFGAVAVAIVGAGDERGVVLGNVPARSEIVGARDEVVAARDDVVAARDDAVGARDETLGAPPARLVRHFYADLDAGRFGAAWARLAPPVRARFGGFETWRRGYATTLGHDLRNVTVDRDGVVRHTLVAVDRTACGGTTTRRFAVRWRLAADRATELSAVKLAGREPEAAC